jgi:cobyrinic acid a,c-diamide synthase
VGKTSVSCGLIGALHGAGLRVQGFKVGPDYIDPSYHRAASGRPGRNLDAFLSGPELIAPLFRHGAQDADVAVIEGVMGMFDGASGRGELASTAHVAKLLRAPVVLVLDASAMARSAAAMVHGYASFDPDVHVGGVIFNRVGSDHHEQLLREAVEPLGIPVLGALRRDKRIAAPERHLGLVPAGEHEAQARAALEALAHAARRYLDLDAVLALARNAPADAGPAWTPEPGAPRDAGASGGHGQASMARVALAAGPAFSFHYEENLELLRAAGAELCPFDPVRDEALPPGCGGLVLAGGFPEVFGAELAANAPLRTQIRAFAAAGGAVLAECGGLLYLCQSLDEHAMCGVLPARGSMSARLALGYREAEAATAVPWLAAGSGVRGHEFHYSSVEPVAAVPPAWTLRGRGIERSDGYALRAVQAGYLHVHWAAFPDLPSRFAAVAARPGSAAAA